MFIIQRIVNIFPASAVLYQAILPKNAQLMGNCGVCLLYTSGFQQVIIRVQILGRGIIHFYIIDGRRMILDRIVKHLVYQLAIIAFISCNHKQKRFFFIHFGKRILDSNQIGRAHV